MNKTYQTVSHFRLSRLYSSCHGQWSLWYQRSLSWTDLSRKFNV